MNCEQLKKKYNKLFHGTTLENWRKIRENGLKRRIGSTTLEWMELKPIFDNIMEFIDKKQLSNNFQNTPFQILTIYEKEKKEQLNNIEDPVDRYEFKQELDFEIEELKEAVDNFWVVGLTPNKQEARLYAEKQSEKPVILEINTDCLCNLDYEIIPSTGISDVEISIKDNIPPECIKKIKKG